MEVTVTRKESKPTLWPRVVTSLAREVLCPMCIVHMFNRERTALRVVTSTGARMVPTVTLGMVTQVVVFKVVEVRTEL